MKEAAWQKGSKDHHCGRSVSGNWQEKHRNCGRDGRADHTDNLDKAKQERLAAFYTLQDAIGCSG
jgi:hypothetical protein